MERKTNPELIAHDVQNNELVENKRKELLGNLASSEYAGYQEHYNGDTKAFIEKLKSYGIKVKKMGILLDLRSKIAGIKMVGLGIGPLIGVGKESKNIESTVNHEVIHVKQYRENSDRKFFKARLGFIKFGILEQGKIMRTLKSSRDKYGKRAARRYAINNSPMEFEAYLHEGDTGYLEKRKPFAYKEYEDKEGRSSAVQKLMDNDIVQRLDKVNELTRMVNTQKEITPQEVNAINTLIEEVLEDTHKIQAIKEKYGKGDRELISTFKTPKGPMVRLESEKNRDKRLSLLGSLLNKEHVCVEELKKHPNIKICTSQADMDESGIIKVEARDNNIEYLFWQLQFNKTIEMIAPHIVLDTSTSKPYIRISFTK